MIWKQKIPAGALQFVLFVGAVIAVLLLSFVLVSYSHNVFKKKTDVTIEVIRTADVALRKSFLIPIKNGETKRIPLNNGLGIEAEVSRMDWGLLELRKVMARKAAFEFEKLAFVGYTQNERPALYLEDNQRPLVLAGSTKIQGTAYLPERGVKMGNVYGNGYYASQLIFGEEKRSTNQLPQFSQDVKRKIEELTGTTFSRKGEPVRLQREMVLKNSFKERTKWIQGDVLELDNVTLLGNIIVRASRKIRVRNSSRLSDVLLLAPSIEIENWTKGNFQAIATKTIRVGKGAELAYPSVLAVKARTQDSILHESLEPNISLDTYANVRGMVLYKDERGPERFKPHIKIREFAKVHGEVYCTQNVELRGSVYGSLTTSGFVALENGNIYQNHIYNGHINGGMLPVEYAGVSYNAKGPNQVAKWAY
ncbi:MAG: hypothetical protein AAGC45_06665 [Bacteroidota bacterium]